MKSRRPSASRSKSPPKTEKTETPEDELPPPVDRPKIWHAQHAQLLKQWADVASIYRWMHYETHLHYAKLNFWLTLPTIIISSITGTLNFAQASFPAEYATLLPIGIGTLNLIAGAITTVASFLRVSELAEGNRVAAISFGKLSRNIRTELLLPSGQRTMDGTDFIQMCRIDLDRMTEQTPDIPDHVVTRFNKKFAAQLASKKYYQPEICVLQPVEIYTDEKEEREQRIARVVANAAKVFQTSPKTSPQLQPVSPPSVVVPVTPFKLTPTDAREQVREELHDLSRMGAVSSRIGRRLMDSAIRAKTPKKAAVQQEIASVLESVNAKVMDDVSVTTQADMRAAIDAMEKAQVQTAEAALDLATSTALAFDTQADNNPV